MKIGILTFHRAHNYGAMLQAFALKTVLCNMGNEVEFIAYKQPKIEEAYKPWTWSLNCNLSIIENLKNFISSLYTLKRRTIRNHRFLIFKNNFLPETKLFNAESLSKYPLNYDAVIFGSDQIWTTRFLGTFDDIYWGNINLPKGKKIAYAPSMELKDLNIDEMYYIERNINNFTHISAREPSLTELLKRITGKEVYTVLDPTLLCNKKDYHCLLKCPYSIPFTSYIFVYQVGNFPIVREIAEKVSEILNLPIIEAGSEVLYHKDRTYLDDAAPDNFLKLLDNAAFVVSCSFHGTAFSVNFHKPFYSVLVKGIDSRATSFLNQVNLLDRGIRSVNEVDPENLLAIDFQISDKKIDNLREESILYIKQSIN